MASWIEQHREPLFLCLQLSASWIIHTVLLWCLIKVQRLNCRAAGLLISSAVGTVVAQLPIVGVYLSPLVMLGCLWKATGADLVPDVVFTVVISRAVMFCVNLWVLGALMGGLETRFSAQSATTSATTTNAATAAVQTAKLDGHKSVNPPSASSLRRDLGLSVRGIMFRSTQPLAMLTWARGNFQMVPGETFALETRNGHIQIRCDHIRNNAVLLTVGEDEHITLSLR
jgi:hypothetical protein